jgi:hypothetical protein
MLAIGLFAACTKQQVLNTASSSASEQNLPIAQIPQQVISYVDNNYPDADISSAVTVKNSSAKTIVRLSTNEEVAFDATNRCMGNGSGMHPGDGHGGGHGHGNEEGHHPGDISVDSLASAITTYISTNYAGYTTMHAHKDSLCTVGAVIDVMVRNGSAEPIKLVFDASNNFVMSCSRIDYTATPQTVQDSVTANYAGFTVKSKCEQLNLSAGTAQYRIFMKDSSTRKRVIFEATGTMVCEQ